MKYETIVCPFCGNGHAHITYEENRVYQMNCPDCHNAIFHRDTSWDNAVSFFKRMVVTDESALRQQETVAKCRDLFDEDGGEILSSSSEMTLDDAIAHLDDTLSDTGRKWSCESCRQEHVQLRAWLAELREIKQNRNEPLTLDELRQMDGEDEK